MTNTQSIHGHEIIHLIHDAAEGGAPFTRTALAAHVAGCFGPDARFHTCSVEGLALDGLLEFLIARQKLIERPDGRLVAIMDHVCEAGR